MGNEHPVFTPILQNIKRPLHTRHSGMPSPWREHFPNNQEEARAWKPIIFRYALESRVIAVAKTRIEGAWAAYVDAVPGHNHDEEQDAVLAHGTKLAEPLARTWFPQFEGVPYAH